MTNAARIAALAVAAGLGFPAGAAACSCIQIDAESALKTSRAAVVGTVTGVGEPTPRPDGTQSSGDPITVTIRVARSYKRTIGRTLRVRTAWQSATCGLGARKGERLAVLLTRSGRRWTTSLCQRVRIGELDAAARRLGLRKRVPRSGTASAASARACGLRFPPMTGST